MDRRFMIRIGFFDMDFNIFDVIFLGSFVGGFSSNLGGKWGGFMWIVEVSIIGSCLR